MKPLRAIIPATISLVLIFIIIRLAPWDQVWQALTGLTIADLLALASLGLCYYFIKIVRYWYMLRLLGAPLALPQAAQMYLAAQPVSLIPGGELYRVRILKSQAGIATARVLPIFTTQGILEGFALATLGLFSALQLQVGRLSALGLLLVVMLGVAGVRMGGFRRVLPIMNSLPLVDVSKARIRSFSSNSQSLLSGRSFYVLTGLSILAEICGVCIAYLSVIAVGGSIGWAGAAFLYVAPIIVGFVSFLPGGFGAAEQVAIGWLLFLGQGGTIAVAATLLMRTSIVIAGLVYGLIAMATLPLRRKLRVR